MSEKFRNRYRISTTRAKWWDYGNGSYFITICTRNRIHYFGEFIEGKFYQSNIGNLAEKYWMEIAVRFTYARLGVFVIMPNHMHGIVNICGVHNESSDLEISAPVFSDNAALLNKGGITGNHNPMLHQNISRVIRWYTSRVSYEAHKINPDFNWQRRFDDRIIRDSEEYNIRTKYIQQNPLNWKEDEFY